jgi:hypothetical protein
MFDPARHVADPHYPAWDEGRTREAIAEIAADALAAGHPETLWPAHPLDDGVPDGLGCVYFGAAGIIWALDALRRRGFIGHRPDFVPYLAAAEEKNAAWYAGGPYPKHASLLMGDLGILLVRMRVAPVPGLADRIFATAARNNDLPVLELMWGLPGSMLACVHMAALTGEARFGGLFQTPLARLLAELETDGPAPIWTQDLYGARRKFLGPVHGFAGNMLPLFLGWRWLSTEQQSVVENAIRGTLAWHAIQTETGINWPATVPHSDAPPRPPLCQYCHGAPGIVTSLAGAPFSDAETENHLVGGAELTWAAGPLLKGSNLCHGTGGNGYAFLKLFARTGETLWLDRARAFAMAAIGQMRAARAVYGQGRYSLWTGDTGLAIYLADCIDGVARFPTVDVM